MALMATYRGILDREPTHLVSQRKRGRWHVVGQIASYYPDDVIATRGELRLWLMAQGIQQPNTRKYKLTRI